jgi:hypothetical protein
VLLSVDKTDTPFISTISLVSNILRLTELTYP